MWLVVVAFPLGAVVALLGAPAPAGGPAAGTDAYVPIRPAGQLLAETAGYAALVAGAALLLGWAPGRLLGARAGRRDFPLLAALVTVPLCLPSYVVFYAWWQSWPPDSALYGWAVEHDLLGAARRATLVLGLAAWSWPLVAWCVAMFRTGDEATLRELLALDGAGRGPRVLAALRADAPGLALGGLVVALFVFGDTTSFDLAGVFTLGNELRARDALGAAPGDVARAAFVAVALGAAGAIVVWRVVGRTRPPLPAAVDRTPRIGAAIAAAVWLATVLLPVVLFASSVPRARTAEFFSLYGRGLADTAGLAVAVGAVGALVTLGLTLAWLDHRRWVRGAAHVAAVGWLVAALAPGTLVALGFEATFNRPLSLGGGATLADLVYRSPLVLVAAHVARFGLVAALLARWVSRREAPAVRDVRRLDGVDGLIGRLVAVGPRLGRAAVAAALVVAVLSFGEVAMTARLHPPGMTPLAVSVLNDMHYQRPQTVMVAVAGLLVAAGAAAAMAAILCAPRPGRRMTALGASAVALLAAAGCTGGDPGEPGRPLRVVRMFGTTGTALGQFSYPRCAAVDAVRGRLYVVDKTARVQCYDLDGTPLHQWRMPAWENGKPTGVSVAPDGRVFVADTHYYRIIAYDGTGRELMRFGRYGEGPGEFIYPTDVAFGPGGRLYVAEYGGHDRVQVFSPEGAYLFEFGSFGAGPDQFDRPQAMAFSADGTELYIADACNHRIVVVDPEGRTQRIFGGPGTAAGELHYPYGISVLPDGTLLVCEFGNNRLQRFAPDGTSLGLYGRLGLAEGELRYPWTVATTPRYTFVLDSGNDRVQVMRTPG